MAVSIAYQLLDSGATCRIEVGDQQAQLFTSPMYDALESLLRAIVVLLRGAPETAAVFAEVPGEYRCRFSRPAPDRLSVRILWFPDWPSHLPDERGEIVLEAECRLRTFAGAVLAASQQVLTEHGAEGYARQAQYRFPAELQAQLKQQLDEGVGRAS